MIFDDSVNENKALLKKYTDVWDRIKNKIKTIYCAKENDYGKNYMEIKFNYHNDLPLNKPLKFYDHNYQICFWKRWWTLPASSFRRHFVWIIKMLQYVTIDVSEGINKTNASKEFMLCHY